MDGDDPVPGLGLDGGEVQVGGGVHPRHRGQHLHLQEDRQGEQVQLQEYTKVIKRWTNAVLSYFEYLSIVFCGSQNYMHII